MTNPIYNETHACARQIQAQTYLDIVTPVVMAAFAEKSMMYDMVYIELIEKRISVLSHSLSPQLLGRLSLHTFDTEAVKTTTS